MTMLHYLAAVVALCAISAGVRAVEPVAYDDLSNEELKALVQQWETLDVEQRRAVATEINRRARVERRVIRIEAERRYGYRVHQSDGSVLTVERRQQIIRYVDPSRPYGVGFEERAGSAPEAPVERVSHPNAPSQ